MDLVSVKIPREKSKYVRLLKAELMRNGELAATDAEVLGEALEFSYEREKEFVDRNRKNGAETLVKYAGSWKMTDKEESRLLGEMREWRKMDRKLAW